MPVLVWGRFIRGTPGSVFICTGSSLEGQSVLSRTLFCFLHSAGHLLARCCFFMVSFGALSFIFWMRRSLPQNSLFQFGQAFSGGALFLDIRASATVVSAPCPCVALP